MNSPGKERHRAEILRLKELSGLLLRVPVTELMLTVLLNQLVLDQMLLSSFLKAPALDSPAQWMDTLQWSSKSLSSFLVFSPCTRKSGLQSSPPTSLSLLSTSTQDSLELLDGSVMQSLLSTTSEKIKGSEIRFVKSQDTDTLSLMLFTRPLTSELLSHPQDELAGLVIFPLRYNIKTIVKQTNFSFTTSI